MEFNISNLITLLIAFAGGAYGYGILNQKVKGLEAKVREIDDIRDEVHKISDTLQKLVGQFDIIVKMYCKESNGEHNG